jgi:cytochrome c-type biogenesis protein CcmH/NrfF
VSSAVAKKLFRIVALSGVLLSVFASTGDEARFNNLGHQMICMCGCNQILLECNHVGCTYSDKMRGQLMALLSSDRRPPSASGGVQSGDSDTQVQQWFVQEYGLTVLAAPVNSGFGRVAWITPFAVFLAALLLAALVIRNWKLRPATVTGSDNTAGSAELIGYREQARRETEL